MYCVHIGIVLNSVSCQVLLCDPDVNLTCVCVCSVSAVTQRVSGTRSMRISSGRSTPDTTCLVLTQVRYIAQPLLSDSYNMSVLSGDKQWNDTVLRSMLVGSMSHMIDFLRSSWPLPVLSPVICSYSLLWPYLV